MAEKIDSCGLLLEVECLHRELNSLTQTKNDLLIYKQQFDAFFDNAPDMAPLKDQEGRYIRINKQA